MTKLAIIIPAFKEQFFKETLDSIACQTDKNFTLYIGDDCSKDDLRSIIKLYSDRIEIVYQRFDTNLGGTDLIGQWHRCIELAKEEDWIWLFSDDDVLQSDCVEKFHRALIETDSKFDLYRFNSRRINHIKNKLEVETCHPQIESGCDFLTRKLRRETDSYAVEYIFRRSTYKKFSGFVRFPVAWASDDATWALYGEKTGIYTISDSFVDWRYSGQNLSSIQTIELSLLKQEAIIQFIKWIKELYGEKIPDGLLFEWAMFQNSLLKNLSQLQKVNFLKQVIYKVQINPVIVIRHTAEISMKKIKTRIRKLL